jgi:hypothetical protein
MSTHDPSHSAEQTDETPQRISVTAVRQMVISTAVMALVLISLTGAFVIMRNTQQMVEAQENKYFSYLLADELRQSSDDLTRMVRTYAETGDERYKEWFQDIIDIREGRLPRPERYHSIYWDFVVSTGVPPRPSGPPVALKTLMKKQNFTDVELDLLATAQNESNSLAELEAQAMNAMVGLYKDASGNYTVRGRPDPALASRLLHGDEYHMAKKRVMNPVEKFFDSVEKRTTKDIKRFQEREELLVFMLIGTTCFAAMLAIVSIIMMADSARKL